MVHSCGSFLALWMAVFGREGNAARADSDNAGVIYGYARVSTCAKDLTSQLIGTYLALSST
jgi:hypothetical protein